MTDLERRMMSAILELRWYVAKSTLRPAETDEQKARRPSVIRAIVRTFAANHFPEVPPESLEQYLQEFEESERRQRDE